MSPHIQDTSQPPPPHEYIDLARYLHSRATIAGTTRQDADTSIITTARSLVHVLTQVYEQQFPELKGMEFLPASPERPSLGKTQFTWREEEIRGNVLMTGTMLQDAPSVDVGVEEAPMQRFMWLQSKYGWTQADIWTAAEEGVALPAKKAKAVKEIMAHRHDDLILVANGGTKWGGLYGLFALPGTLTYTPLVGDASGTTAWEGKTAQEIFRDMWRSWSLVRSTTNSIEMPDVTILPDSCFDIASEKRMGDANQSSPIDWFLERVRKRVPNYQVLSSVKLEANAIEGVSTRRMITYKRDAKNVYRLDAAEFAQFAPTPVGTGVEVQCYAKSGGCVSPKKKSICKTDGI